MSAPTTEHDGLVKLLPGAYRLTYKGKVFFLSKSKFSQRWWVDHGRDSEPTLADAVRRARRGW